MAYSIIMVLKRQNASNLMPFFLIFLLLGTIPAYSLTRIYLVDGSVVKGSIISQDDDTIKIKDNSGVVTVDRIEIEKIYYSIETLGREVTIHPHSISDEPSVVEIGTKNMKKGKIYYEDLELFWTALKQRKAEAKMVAKTIVKRMT